MWKNLNCNPLKSSSNFFHPCLLLCLLCYLYLLSPLWAVIFMFHPIWWRLIHRLNLDKFGDTAYLCRRYPSIDFLKDSNYQLDFVENHNGHVNITDLPDLVAFTICFWMKTSDNTSAGTPIWYRVRYETKGKYITAIALVDYRGFYVYVGEWRS